MKYCTHCGAELVDAAVVCPKCGCAAGTTGQFVAGGSGVSQKLVVGIVMIVLGLTGLIYSLLNVTSFGFNFASGDRATLVYGILVGSIAAIIAGAIALLTKEEQLSEK